MTKALSILIPFLFAFSLAAAQEDDLDGRAPVLKAGESMTIRVPLDTATVLNGSYPIDSAGFVVLPVLGKLYVHDRKADDVATFIGGKMSQYLRDTHVMIDPSIRLTMLGHWTKPGMRYIHSEATVWEACLVAGGPAGERHMDQWKVMRGDQVIQVSLLNEFSKGTSLRNCGIKSGDIFVIPVPIAEEGFWYWFKESLTATAQIATIATAALTGYLTYLAVEGRNP